MSFKKRNLIYLFLVVDLVLLNISLVIVSFFHYGEMLTPNALVVLLNVTWLLTYVFNLDDSFFDIDDIVKRARNLLKKVLFYVAFSALLFVVLDLDDISRAMFLGSSLVFL